MKIDPAKFNEADLQSLAGYNASPAADPGALLATINFIKIAVPTENVNSVMQKIVSIPGVLLAEPDNSIVVADAVPNDPAFIGLQQYGLTAIHAPQGWDLSTGSSSVTIAIVDTGVDLTHPDLSSKIVVGYNVLNTAASPQDDNGHGTHVAGIAAAVTNNGIGVAGTSWGARIMPVKVLNASGGGSESNIASGIIWAADHGAQVINLSLGIPSATTTAIGDAITYAYTQKGVTIVAAAGNHDPSNPMSPSAVDYPAAYPQVIAVAASDQAGQWWTGSNYGPQVDVTAPGVNVYSTYLPTQQNGNLYYTDETGTSMAAAFVSGEAAILKGMRSSLQPADIQNLIESSALDIATPGVDVYTGHGLIQLDSAIQLLLLTPQPNAQTGRKQHKSQNTALLSSSPAPTSMPAPTATPAAIPPSLAVGNSVQTGVLSSALGFGGSLEPSLIKSYLPSDLCIGSLTLLGLILLIFWAKREKSKAK